jgi:multidrug efflux pump subunit AcrB
LGDIAEITLDEEKTIREEMMYDGQHALGISIAASSGTDIVKVGHEVTEKMKKLKPPAYLPG